MTMTFGLDLDGVKMNHLDKYLGQRSFRSKFIVWTQTHTPPSALPGPPKWSITTLTVGNVTMK